MTAIGGAKGAIVAFREQHQSPINLRDQRRVSEDPFTQLGLGRMSDLDRRSVSAHAAEFRGIDAPHPAPRSRSPSAPLPLGCGKATDWEVHAVDRLTMASGGRGIFRSKPIQRAWRDGHAMQAGIMPAAMSNAPPPCFVGSEFGPLSADFRF